LTARRLLERCLAIREAKLGPDHLEVGNTLTALADIMKRSGDKSAARRMFERVLAIRESHLGPHHLDVAKTLVQLADVLRKSQDKVCVCDVGCMANVGDMVLCVVLCWLHRPRARHVSLLCDTVCFCFLLRAVLCGTDDSLLLSRAVHGHLT
jgi:hypothetical protein